MQSFLAQFPKGADLHFHLQAGVYAETLLRFAGLAIGLGLTLIHLISIPVTNTSVNPARSTAPALFVGGWALEQLWLFWVAPIIGAAVAGVAYRAVFEPVPPEPPITGRA